MSGAELELIINEKCDVGRCGEQADTYVPHFQRGIIPVCARHAEIIFQNSVHIGREPL